MPRIAGESAYTGTILAIQLMTKFTPLHVRGRLIQCYERMQFALIKNGIYSILLTQLRLRAIRPARAENGFFAISNVDVVRRKKNSDNNDKSAEKHPYLARDTNSG